MSLFFSSLNSGSNGNCYYVGNNTEAVLVDAGLSCREIEKRMKRAGLEIEKVKAIFVSHEHGDHITGIPALSKKYQLPVYITQNTLKGSKIPVEEHLVHSFEADKPVTLGELAITPFVKSHDAADPHSFLIAGNGVKVGVFTDIGYSCKRLIHYFSQCQAAFLESNYCEDMLMNGNYPYHLKKRISGDDGHLSNAQALELFIKYRNPSLSHLILSHLSKNNNSPSLVEQLFNEKAGHTKITVASRYQETAVFSISDSSPVEKQPNRVLTAKKKQQNQYQLSLF
jgi:phosphoribosyl 1,2-cyclic phosphodiesterase